MEAEAREREEQQLLEEQRQRQEEEEAALQKELLRLQELHQHRAAKKKKKERANENTAPPQNTPQPLRQTAQNVLDKLHNGRSRLLQTLIHLPDRREPKLNPLSQPNTCPAAKAVSNETNIPHPTAPLHNGTCPVEVNSKAKSKQSGKVVTTEPAAKIVPEVAKNSGTTKTSNGIVPTTSTDTKLMRIGPAETAASLPTTELCREERSNTRCSSEKRQQQQPLTQIKENRTSPLLSNPSPSPPSASQTETQQNGKPPVQNHHSPRARLRKARKRRGTR